MPGTPRKNRRVSRPPKKETDVSKASQKENKTQKKGFFAKMLRCFIWMIFILMICVTIGAVGAYRIYLHISEGLPQISSLKDYRPPIITTVYSDDNRKIAEFYKERRIVVPYDDIPKTLINAFVAAEDSRFFTHRGVDIISIIRAFFKNIEAGATVQGGSTITQQVTRSFLLTPEKSYERKIKEAILAYRIDNAFTKEEILFLYLNQIYLGHGAYGVGAAAENCFGKSVKELNVAECALLAGLPQAPGRYSPFAHLDKAKERQKYVLNRMLIEGYITSAQLKEALDMPLEIKPRRNYYMEKVPYYTEHVRRYIEEKFGKDALYTEGFKIYTAVNIEMQNAAHKAVEKGLRAYDKRHGYRGPEKYLSAEEIEKFSADMQKRIEKKSLKKGHIIKAVVIDNTHNHLTLRMGNARGILESHNMRWARKSKISSIGTVIWVKLIEKPENSEMWRVSLEQTPDAQSALLCLETETGHVKAMVGGRDFRTSQFNRAVQAVRQPGSAFKPIIYAAAIDKGYTPATEIIDNAIVWNQSRYRQWKPKNYDRRFYGPTLLRKALAKSRNLATIKILDDIGIDYAINYAHKLGINSRLGHNPSLALGTSEVSLLELVNAYSVFANLGYLIEPVFITKIVDRYGNEIQEIRSEPRQVIDASTAYIMTSLLESVVRSGTGRKVRVLNRPVAGKTGTTNDLHDAWFVGYSPDYVAGAWIGYDKERSLGRGESGSRAAIPIWLDFMKSVLKDKPVRQFKVPGGIVFSKIDAATGLLPVPESPEIIFECFKEGTVPTKYTARPGAVNKADQFFKADM